MNIDFRYRHLWVVCRPTWPYKMLDNQEIIFINELFVKENADIFIIKWISNDFIIMVDHDTIITTLHYTVLVWTIVIVIWSDTMQVHCW